LLDRIEPSEAEVLSEKFNVDIERIEEGLLVQQMISNMPKKVTAQSKWFVLDMTWV